MVIALFLKTGFTFNGVSSTTHKLVIVHTDNGMIQTPFGLQRNIQRERIQYGYKSILQGFQEEPLKFSVTMALEDDVLQNRQWTTQKRMDIAKWLFVNTYKTFVSDDDTTVMYKCVPVNANRFINALAEGYATLEFECDSPFAYKNASQLTVSFDLRNVQSVTKTVVSDSNIAGLYRFYPEINIYSEDADCDVTITNQTNSSVLGFSDLTYHEEVVVKGQQKQLIFSGDNHFSKWNKGWLYLNNGNNTVVATGDPCTITLTIVCPIMI